MFGLIDGNSFYCSCERAFDPKLRGVPLVVLSNNDGCAIARTREAKLAGVKMGEPWHLIKDKPGIKGVVDWRSSNYELYGDMSRRMYQVLAENFPAVEPYSIDEMFVDMRGLNDLVGRSHAIRIEVRKTAKIPTCVGIGPTKTIAKLANGFAKDYHADIGVCDMSTPEQRAKLYRDIPLGEVWGMGSQSVKKMAKLGIETVADFVAMPSEEVRKNLTVTGMRTQAELRGRPCLSLSFAPPPKKMLAVTRSFGRVITDRAEMRQAVATYAEIAGRRLRASGMVAAGMQVFLMTNRFKPMFPQYHPQQTFAIEATADTMALIGSATRSMDRMWRDGYPASHFMSRHDLHLVLVIPAVGDRAGQRGDPRFVTDGRVAGFRLAVGADRGSLPAARRVAAACRWHHRSGWRGRSGHHAAAGIAVAQFRCRADDRIRPAGQIISGCAAGFQRRFGFVGRQGRRPQ